MTMKSVLVSLEDAAAADAVLATALLVARQFGSHLEGVSPRSAMGAFVVSEGMSVASATAVESLAAEDEARAERARDRFLGFMEEQGVTRGAPAAPGQGPSAAWLEDSSQGDEAVGQRGRLYDLIVTGRPQRGQPAPRLSTLEALLFESGRPVLIAPPTLPPTLGETVVIGWNGSTETARATALAAPFLERAKRVLVISVEGGSVPGPNAGELATYLRRDGIAAESDGVQAKGRSIGEALLDAATGAGADLIVKGAYTHSRLRQMIFGGATSHLLAEAEVPVLMAH